MEILRHVVVLVHLVGFAVLFGAWVVEAVNGKRRFTRLMDWGLAIAESREYLPESWWAVTFPGLAILITVLGFNLFGDGLRDLVDPRLRRSR